MKRYVIIFFWSLLLLNTQLSAQNGSADFRLVVDRIDTVLNKAFVNLEIKASSPAQTFGMGSANIRLSFTRELYNPTIVQEYNFAGLVSFSPLMFYSNHNMSGSIDTLISYNILFQNASVQGQLVSTTWMPIGQLSFDYVSPNEGFQMYFHDLTTFPSLSLTSYADNDGVLDGNGQLYPVALGNLEALNYEPANSTQAPCSKDIFEPNDMISTAASMPDVGIYKNATICSEGDVDWFRFELDSDKPNLRVQLLDMDEDLNLQLYGSAGNLIGTANLLGEVSEVLNFNGLTSGTYYVRVYAANASVYSEEGYSLIVQTRDMPFAGLIREDDEDRSQIIDDDAFDDAVKVYPNPARDFLTIHLPTTQNSQLRLWNQYGQVVRVWETRDVQIELEINDLARGSYRLELLADGMRKTFPVELR